MGPLLKYTGYTKQRDTSHDGYLLTNESSYDFNLPN